MSTGQEASITNQESVAATPPRPKPFDIRAAAGSPRDTAAMPQANPNGGIAPSKTVRRMAITWSTEEDQRLSDIVKEHGAKKWSMIATHLPGRKGKQCRERWHNHLNPDVVKTPWSEEEDRIVITMHEEIGNKWSRISKRLPGRTDNAIKNRWNSTLKRQQERVAQGLPPKRVPNKKRRARRKNGAAGPGGPGRRAAASANGSPRETKRRRRARAPRAESPWGSSADDGAPDDGSAFAMAARQEPTVAAAAATLSGWHPGRSIDGLGSLSGNGLGALGSLGVPAKRSPPMSSAGTGGVAWAKSFEDAASATLGVLVAAAMACPVAAETM